MDEATGLYDYGARYYDPAVARWGQVDPLADQYAPYSPYNYVLGNPISLIDPDGMQVDDHIFLDQDNNELFRIETEGEDVYYKGYLGDENDGITAGLFTQLDVTETYLKFDGERSPG